MKGRNIFGIGAIILVALLAGLFGASQPGQNNPVQDPTFSKTLLVSPMTENVRSAMPFTAPVTVTLNSPLVNFFIPFWGLEQFGRSMERMQEKTLDRTAPMTPTGFYQSTFRVGVGVDVPFSCEGTIVGQQYLPDFQDATAAKKDCTDLAKEAIKANRDIELAKIKTSENKTLAKIEAQREIELAKLLPTPEPIVTPSPKTKIWTYVWVAPFHFGRLI